MTTQLKLLRQSSKGYMIAALLEHGSHLYGQGLLFHNTGRQVAEDVCWILGKHTGQLPALVESFQHVLVGRPVFVKLLGLLAASFPFPGANAFVLLCMQASA